MPADNLFATSLSSINLNPTTAQSIEQNVICTLSTRKGTVPLNRSFGTDLTFLDLPMTQEEEVVPDFYEAIERGETRILTENISFVEKTKEGRISPIITYKLKEEA